MKKEYVIFTLTVLVLAGMFLLSQALAGGSPTGLAAAAWSISRSAPLVIIITFCLIGIASFIAYKLTRE